MAFINRRFAMPHSQRKKASADCHRNRPIAPNAVTNGLDTRLLVYAHRWYSGWHERAKTCVRELAEGRAAWASRTDCSHRAAGFEEVVRRGNHVDFPRGRRGTAIVPRHREVALGTLRSVLRQTGLTREEFEAL
jgi:predicted RNA binding protein YcfA (HicA-like mRNA interferase family)